ncbi:hypothetical protein BSKO_02449 [Bryopsis sp. KO-2023]|nr:hypothetical protein BSKO_02449 [Bryopsis sp. KO-2023]
MTFRSRLGAKTTPTSEECHNGGCRQGVTSDIEKMAAPAPGYEGFDASPTLQDIVGGNDFEDIVGNDFDEDEPERGSRLCQLDHPIQILKIETYYIMFFIHYCNLN